MFSQALFSVSSKPVEILGGRPCTDCLSHGAAKMLGYQQNTFSDMLHAMKQYNKLRGDNNVIWHDDGDVEFNGVIIDNMHSWAP
ncbi:hypothetical protein GCT19_27760 [Paraburkholderia sp. CNPSo 3155]|uniref:hypothetical protein n=1 Tax=Paraburkholderia atlantica TaxID=2654982 RepID=UPI00128B526A|nr:hypothetical protein [Paraburkholderia atlantica]MPW09406.1 hypothetical protein [Paraburkholderia atlantica]